MSDRIVGLTKLAGLATAALLASCASTPPPAIQTVQVPVPVSCVKSEPQRPDFEFDKLPVSASDGDKILALVRDWARYRKYTDQLEAVVVGCK